MKLRNFIRVVVPYLPVFLGVGSCFAIVYSLINWLPTDLITPEKNQFVLFVIVIISVLLITVLILFIFTKANQMRFAGNSLSSEISGLSQKIHHFRNIIDILVRSKVWAPGLKEYIDEEFGDLNFFDVKEFYKGRSKLALEFIEENNRYGETENLYLESKSLLLNDPSQSKVDNFSNPRVYDKRILQKWVEHKCGSGLWYFFGYKYASFKDELDVSRVYERHEEKILSYAVQLDVNRYQDMGFSEELLSKIGEQMSEDIIPRLYSLTLQSHQRIPNIINAAYVLLLLLTLSGIFLPISTILFQLPLVVSFISLGFVVSILIFLVLGIYPYVKQEINTEK